MSSTFLLMVGASCGHATYVDPVGPRLPCQQPSADRTTIHGRVLRPTGGPCSLATVEVELLGPTRCVRLATVQADPSGRYRIETDRLRELPPFDRHLFGLACRAFREDWRGANTERVRLDHALPDEVVIDVQVDRGGLLVRGRVVDEDGTPLEGIAVTAVPTADAMYPESRDAFTEHVYRAWTAADGSFWIPLHEWAQLAGFVWAHDDEMRGTVVDLGASADIGDVVLRERGTIEGKVAYPDGTPVTGLEVRACTLLEPHVDLVANPLRMPAEWLGGHIGVTVTDGEGAFAIRRLLPGTYGVEVGGQLRPLSPGRPAAGFVVSEHRLALKVMDEEGRAVTAPWVWWAEPGGETWVGEEPPSLEPGSEIVYGAAVWGVDAFEASMTVPEDVFESRREIVLGIPDEPAWLRPTFRFSDGHRTDRGVIRILSPRAHVEVYRVHIDPDHALVAVPPGTFALQGLASHIPVNGVVAVGHVDGPVDLEPGRVTELEVELLAR